MASRNRLTRWLAGSGLVAGIIAGILAGINPGDTPIAMGTPWQYHAIVTGVAGTGNPDGADGVTVSDMDGDGLLDIATGYEQGLRATLSFNPGPADVESVWPTVTLPNGTNLCSAEDIALADLDGDGAKDIVAVCETGTVRVSIFFAPAPPNTRAELLNAANWTQVDVAASAGNRSMRAIVTNINGTAGNEIVVGGKESSGPCVAAQVGYYVNATPSVQASWSAATFTAVNPVGWVMQMYAQDLDGDTDVDIVYSDREPIDCPTPGGGNQGITVIKATTPGVFAAPVVYLAGEGDHKWFSLFDWDGDTDLDIIDCRSNTTPINTSQVLLNGGSFNSFPTAIPLGMPSGSGQCQHVVATDLDGDAQADLAYSNAQAQNLLGVSWFRVTGSVLAPKLTRGSISGVLSAAVDVKFDNHYCDSDIDGDGDKDCFATEQHLTTGSGPGLGAGYWENPLLTFTAPVQVNCTLLSAGSQTSPDATTYVTASVSPGANRLVTAVIQTAAGAGPVAPTATGNGLTWVQERTQTFSTRRLTALRAMGTPSAGAITFDFAGQTQTSGIWQIIECSNVDTGGTNGSEAIPQSASTSVAASTTFTATLPGALAGATSRLLCFAGLDIASTVTPDADLVEINDANVAAGASTLESQGALNQTACTPTFSSANAGGIVLEVKAQ